MSAGHTVTITQQTFDKLCRIADMSKIDDLVVSPADAAFPASEELRKLSGVPWTAAEAAILAACRKGLTAHDFFNRK